jgi:hypothetical protein
LYLLRLVFVVAHGRDYLSEEEYDRCLKEIEQEYFLYAPARYTAKARNSASFTEVGWRPLITFLPGDF